MNNSKIVAILLIVALTGAVWYSAHLHGVRAAYLEQYYAVGDVPDLTASIWCTSNSSLSDRRGRSYVRKQNRLRFWMMTCRGAPMRWPGTGEGAPSMSFKSCLEHF